ncbi:ABC transporter ATP-binding protein/permease [Bradyrhizobium sp. ISRA443]|uniref:ABCB family ABC transporter ATP-binding protein/permease n=1 Tax=unclassified Bradyrhizobium TaxID=2631580 RepID=UPI00247A020A|nr:MULTISPECIES: ABC transporter ATP-binding protein/permease [unclassified Bradyrhizobium]WGR96960.1 ABC transporter ATP-binding protein/permease [Bradyrhizobium sp. ISRA436]WGS03847.1 ABC transporter ATP-binding protein/permease [Bradyrhizobium sp. ISRA437]WGS10731.1 ABC transporter ATP-binding protein/permease [Bradyrhizobium sp. ISRA443]
MAPPHPHAPAVEAPAAATQAAEKATLIGTLVHLWPYIWPGDRADLKMRVVWSVVVLLFAKLATLSVPFTFKWAIDALNGAGSAPVAPSNWMMWLIASPLLMTIGYGAVRIIMAVLTQWRDGIFAHVAMHAVRRLAYITFVHMHELSLRFHLERKTGGLTRILERGRTGIETIVRMVILQLIPTIVEVTLLAAVLLWQFDWRYVLAVLLTVVVFMYFTYIATEWRIEIRRKMNDSDTEANTKAIDSLLNYETVKYFGAEEREAKRYDRSMERYEQASVKTYTSLAVLNTGQAIIFTVGLTATMLMCALGIRKGTHTVGDFVLINSMMIQLYQPLNFMGMVYREIKQAIIDIEKMFDVLARNPEVKDMPDARPLAVSAGSVRFEDVRFAYEPDRPILKGLSFEVPAGKTVAVVGPSGAGKSTISRLLFRLYDVSSGRILIDGQDIRSVTQASLRASIGMVPQDTVLFNDTIRYNIRYGRWDASDAEVEEAARLAQIDHFIRMSPKGYETQVGERGLKLSGGEKQRVAIARTVLKAPPILVLDEATSALDSHTEAEIQDALERVSRNRTSLVIAHRLSTIVGADEIIVLDQGRIAERGTHARLLAAGGLYAGMWNRQREAEAARERLAQIDDDSEAPNRLPPPVAEPAQDSAPVTVEKPLPTAAE